ncbi:DUF1508 domain-containing protein [bacterium]|nr:DUF1508 domain-containing protein [bacterium]MBU1064386.1 DUF1508 domain-containing protein [bacterium]MBU1635803.1 DUF1508 domain-containing protein [bacterium]MBU1873957.1 DUF1508 domain-containing protein [bacterium]
MAVFQYYKDKSDRWRWRLRNDDGKIIAVSGEGFADKEECLDDLQTAKEVSEISEVRIYETEEDFTVLREAPDLESESIEDVETESEQEPEPEIEPDEIIEPEPEFDESEPETPVFEEDYSDQPDDLPPMIRESSFTAIPDKWKHPNWALITSISAVVIIIILIILFSLRKNPEPRPETLEIISEIQEQAAQKPTSPPPPEPVIKEEPEQIVSELESKVESPELSKVQEPVPMDIFHTVVKGDRLWSLADEYYSDAFLWPNIYNANTKKIKNPDLLKLGIELLIPALQGTHLKLSNVDRRKVADGYLHAYLVYKKLGKTDAKYYLWVAQLYDQSILAEYQGEIDLEDMQIIKHYKKR